MAPELKIILHFHDTRGLGVANAYAGLEMGVDTFDSLRSRAWRPFAGHKGAAGTADISLAQLFLCVRCQTRHPTANVPGDFAAHRGTAAAAITSASVRRSMVMHSINISRRGKCVLMPGKMARSAPRPPFGPPIVPAAARTSRLSCRKAGKPEHSCEFWSHLENPG
jgi:hypothetical protein